jgi:3-oxoacyl-[acyl-carrier-protein] synthase-1
MGTERYVALAMPAIEEALQPLLQLATHQFEINVTIGLPEPRPGVPDDLPRWLEGYVKALNKQNLSIKEFRTAFKGHAAGLMAIESAGRLLASSGCKFCLAGGVDSYIDPYTLDWVEDNEQLHTPSNAWGFMPGEAAAFCLLCSAETAKRFGLPVKAWLLSAATAQEKNRIKTETVCIGEGLTEAVRSAVQALPKEAKINQIFCDQNGEAYRADEFGFMLARLSEHFVDPSDYIAPADCWGDVGAASGPLFINLLCAAAEKDYSTGPYSLLWASSEGGDRSALIMVVQSVDEENA